MNFIVKESGFDKKKVMLDGTRFFVGNGYMGGRGTLEEFGKEELVGCTLAVSYTHLDVYKRQRQGRGFLV